MVSKKEWSEFKNTGLLLIVNQILHVFTYRRLTGVSISDV